MNEEPIEGEVISPGQMQRKPEQGKTPPWRHRFVVKRLGCDGCCVGWILLIAFIYLLFK